MDYHCYYCGLVAVQGYPVNEWAIGDSGPGKNSKRIYRGSGASYQRYYLDATGAQYAAQKVASMLANDIASEFANDVNTNVKGQHLNYETIEKSLISGNGGLSLANALYHLYIKQGGPNAKPNFQSPCLLFPAAKPPSGGGE
jgi:hypothetical protein